MLCDIANFLKKSKLRQNPEGLGDQLRVSAIYIVEYHNISINSLEITNLLKPNANNIEVLLNWNDDNYHNQPTILAQNNYQGIQNKLMK